MFPREIRGNNRLVARRIVIKVSAVDSVVYGRKHRKRLRVALIIAVRRLKIRRNNMAQVPYMIHGSVASDDDNVRVKPSLHFRIYRMNDIVAVLFACRCKLSGSAGNLTAKRRTDAADCLKRIDDCVRTVVVYKYD